MVKFLFKKFGWECVMASDIDKNACDVYEKIMD